ncbi:MAG: histidine kinase [Sphingomonas sp.]|nr:histidine kinase [Sphingomonas sp.]
MWRFVAGAVAALLLAAGGMLWFNAPGVPNRLLASAPAVAGAQAGDAVALPDSVPEATAKTREEKRFGRYDKDKDGTITRDEYLAARRRAYAKLDTDHDGKLSFDEWAIKATTKFATADADRNGAMNAPEFAATAVKRTQRAAAKCPPVAEPSREEES